MKTFSFRFDIDTHVCLRDGVPRLISLAEELGVKFTFFLSVGRSISRTGTLKRILSSPAAQPCAESLSARAKLGNAGYLRLALFNPLIGKAHAGLVRDLYRSQDMGLHGGRNHDVWHHGAHRFSAIELGTELDWALNWLTGQGIRPSGFSCPGWTEPPGLIACLRQKGFVYRADRHGPDAGGGRTESGGIVNLGTNILGEPGGVAYLEHLRARRMNDQAIRADFTERLRRAGDYAVTYDHPYFAGVNECALIRDLVYIARDKGYRVVPMIDLARAILKPAEQKRELA